MISWPARKQHCKASRPLLALALLVWSGLAAAEWLPATLPDWRAEVEQIWIAADNDAPEAYRRALWLQTNAPAGMTVLDRARVLNALARAEINITHMEDALRHAHEARDLAAGEGDKIEQAKADINLSVGAVYASDMETLAGAALHGMTIIDGVDRPELLGEIMLRTAMMYRRKGQIEKSVTLCMQAMDIAKRSNNALAMTYAYHGLAVSYDQSDRYKPALENYVEMRRWAQAVPSKILEAAAVVGMAGAISHREGPQTAEALIREGTALYAAAGAPHLVNHGLYSLAENLRLQGRRKEALTILNDVVSHYERHTSRIPLWWSLNARSEEYGALGQRLEEMADAERAYKLADEIGLLPFRSMSAKRLTDIYSRQGNTTLALKYARESLELTGRAEKESSGERMDLLAERYQSESKQKQIEELTKRNHERSLQARWLITVLGGSLILLLVTTYFLVRLRRSQATLQRQTDILQSILDSMGEGVTVTDEHNELVLANPMAATLLGLHPLEDGKAWSKGFPLYLPPMAGNGAQVRLPLVRALCERSTEVVEIQVDDPALPGGRWINRIVRPIVGKDGGPRGTVAVFSDITARKEALELLKTSEQKFRALAENCPDIIVRYDRDCRRIYVNPRYEKETGIPVARVQGTLISEEWNSQRKLKPLEYEIALRQVMATGEPADIILEWCTADGRTTTHAISMVPERLWGDEVSGVLAIAHDITALKEAEHRLTESYGMLRELAARRETAREEERARIARELHDELGQLITALRLGISTLRLQFGASNPALSERVRSLTELADKALQGMRDVATLLRPPALDMGIAAALEWLAAEFSRHTGLPCEFSAPRHPVDLDQARSIALFRLVQESLTNVARHAKANSVRVSLSANASGYQLEVRDDGKGFDPAQVGKRSYGLAGMRERSTLFGGEVAVESAPGQGTVVRVDIPFIPSRESAA